MLSTHNYKKLKINDGSKFRRQKKTPYDYINFFNKYNPIVSKKQNHNHLNFSQPKTQQNTTAKKKKIQKISTNPEFP
jgi:hypothetical protein